MFYLMLVFDRNKVDDEYDIADKVHTNLTEKILDHNLNTFPLISGPSPGILDLTLFSTVYRLY